jgi:hypothetical protein
MAMPHADDASGGSPRSPNKYNEASVERPNGNEARLAIITSIVSACEMKAGQYFAGAPHIEPTFPQRPSTFRRIAGYAH